MTNEGAWQNLGAWPLKGQGYERLGRPLLGLRSALK